MAFATTAFEAQAVHCLAVPQHTASRTACICFALVGRKGLCCPPNAWKSLVFARSYTTCESPRSAR
jgi:hypothetical protein